MRSFQYIGMQTFDALMQRLNPEQRRAVETVEGPVMVVAGPGTGKTQVLAMRVASILRRTQARPSNILCLTYSNAGATAMRERLRSLIGPDAYGVTVDTVHGFCDALMRRHATTFSDWMAGTQLQDLQKYRLMQSIIDDVSATSALINPKNPYDRIPAILGRISDCKREGKTLADLLRVADLYDAEMAVKSREGTKAHAKNLLQARKFRDFVDLFRRYSERLLSEGLYDYDDMILTVLRAFREEEWLLCGLQERYQYILVDEAQDLNGAQWSIIQHLTTYQNVPHDPNFFLVGDDDQSIYRFQGANMEHLLNFRERFPTAPIIVLTTNYRSTQAILDAAGRLISHNDERLIGRIPGLQKDLRAATTESGESPTLLRAPSDVAETWLLADLCDERLRAGIPAEDIAVLVQTNAELYPLYDVFRARGIPVVMHGKADLLTHPLVLQALTILRSVEENSDDAFVHALGCACFGCHAADVSRVIVAARDRKIPVHDVLLQEELTTLGIQNPTPLLSARDALLDLRMQSASRSLLQTVEAMLRTSHLIRDAETLDPLDLAAIEAFFQYVKQRCLDHPFLDLAHFLDDMRYYTDEGYVQLCLTYQMPHLVTSGVQLLTAHQSKGLEFHTVFLAAFREGHWDERSTKTSLAVPEELLFGWGAEQKRWEKHQDERRVAYVAMTRAKRELFFLCPHAFAIGERMRSVAPSAFYAEAGPLPERDATLQSPATSSLFVHHPVRDIDAELATYLRDRLQTFALSPSSLSSFLKDPQEFLHHHLLHQPERHDESSMRSLAYGSAVHWALRDWATEWREGKAGTLEHFLEAFSWYLSKKTILTRQQCDDLLAQASRDLPIYFHTRLLGAQPTIYATEREYRAHLGDIPLKGKIDRIDLVSPNSGDMIVIDFKTGKPKTPSMIRGSKEPGTVSRDADGDNFRQLVFYALLLEQAEPTYTPQVFRLEYIGERGEEPIQRDFTIVESEKDSLRTLIRDVWAKIVAHDFTPL